MRNDARNDVLKVWLYAAAAVLLGAWVSPLLFNAGKALADVSSSKTMNGFLAWLAHACEVADFARFFEISIILAALVLFLPWLEWIHSRRGAVVDGAGPWLLRLPDGARVPVRGQPLQKNLRGLWDGCAGFMLVAGLLLSLGATLVPSGWFVMRPPSAGLAGMVTRTALWSLGLALVMELFFRGIVMGIFLRAMRPVAALGWSAVFFALVISMAPPHGLQMMDPDAGKTGFDLLFLLLWRLIHWPGLIESFAPLLALGVVLAYARWRTASLWLPVGLHTGWLTAKSVLAQLSMAKHADGSIVNGVLLQQGLVPLISIILAGLLARHITFAPANEEPVFS